MAAAPRRSAAPPVDMASIAFKAVCKVFGPDPGAALALSAEGLAKDEIRERTGSTIALDHVSVEVPAGLSLAVIGQSGSGKSTLVRLVNRLITPDRGDILVDGRSVPNMDKTALARLRRHDVSMVFQSFALFPHMNVLANIAYGLKIRGVDRNEREETAMVWLRKVGLTGYEQAFPGELSGGMQQRAGLARALATGPKILLMDEPFSALDPLLRREMQDQLLQLRQELKITVLFITHDLGEALRLGDQIAVLKAGKAVQNGTPVDILERPADDYVAALVQTLEKPLL